MKMHQKSFVCSWIVTIIALFLGGILCEASPDSVTNGTSTTNDPEERTLILLKPDAVQRGLIGKIIERFENKGFKLVAMKFISATQDVVEKHYVDHAQSYFFRSMVDWMISSPIIAMVWEGWNVIKISRRMLGPPDSFESLPGTIRGDFSMHFGLSVIHGAHSIEAANREIPLWFGKDELISWTKTNSIWTHPNATISTKNLNSTN